MAAHFAEHPEHSCTIDLNSGAVFCYRCDDWVVPSLAGPAVSKVQSTLSKLREPAQAVHSATDTEPDRGSDSEAGARPQASARTVALEPKREGSSRSRGRHSSQSKGKGQGENGAVDGSDASSRFSLSDTEGEDEDDEAADARGTGGKRSTSPPVRSGTDVTEEGSDAEAGASQATGEDDASAQAFGSRATPRLTRGQQ